MKILILNSILFTPHKGVIPKMNSIKDTMIYNMCLGFMQNGHKVSLIAAEEYRPVVDEIFDFEITFFKSTLSRIFRPDLLPFHFELIKYLRKNEFDLIISSETFSMQTLIASILKGRKVIIWQELAKHNNLFFKIPSKFWYNVVCKVIVNRALLIIPRSSSSSKFIKSYANNVSNDVLDHGVNIDRFGYSINKKNQFVVVGQLISRKRIDAIISIFNDYIKKVDSSYKLLIIGKGEEYNMLKEIVNELNINSNVLFLGFMNHIELNKIVRDSKALLIYSQKDMNMVSIPESIVSGTPVLTNTTPMQSNIISSENYGIVKDNWTFEHLMQIIDKNESYVSNCVRNRENFSNRYIANKFVDIFNKHTCR